MFLVGFFLVKLLRLKYRWYIFLFSEKVFICKEDGDFCLEIWVGDLWKFYFVDILFFGIFVSEKVFKEGIVYFLY